MPPKKSWRPLSAVVNANALVQRLEDKSEAIRSGAYRDDELKKTKAWKLRQGMRQEEACLEAALEANVLVPE